MHIKTADFSNPDVLALIRLHMAGMHQNSPPENVCGLDLSGLRVPGIELFTLWNDDGALMGMGAVRLSKYTWAEVKSMRTHPDHTRKGVAVKLLDHIVSRAKEEGVTWLSLETGSGPAFDPSVKLYLRYGFKKGERFGDYIASDFNQFFHLDLR